MIGAGSLRSSSGWTGLDSATGAGAAAAPILGRAVGKAETFRHLLGRDSSILEPRPAQARRHPVSTRSSRRGASRSPARSGTPDRTGHGHAPIGERDRPARTARLRYSGSAEPGPRDQPKQPEGPAFRVGCGPVCGDLRGSRPAQRRDHPQGHAARSTVPEGKRSGPCGRGSDQLRVATILVGSPDGVGSCRRIGGRIKWSWGVRPGRRVTRRRPSGRPRRAGRSVGSWAAGRRRRDGERPARSRRRCPRAAGSSCPGPSAAAWRCRSS